MPPFVRRLIEARADAASFSALKRSAAALSDAYRQGRATRIATDDDVTAYLATRMPATYAAMHAALAQLPPLAVHSVLDLGAGTGAASLAARDSFPDATSFTLVERDPSLADAAREFLPDANVIASDLTNLRELEPHDLVIAGYSLGEIEADLAVRLWDAARVALVIVEPGTPRGSARIAALREQLLALGAHMAAPCPAAMPCPLQEPDWCHFAARVERTSLHRRLKDGGLGYEDEKFSYVAVVRDPVVLEGSRILRHPRHHPGWIELELCTVGGPRSERVTKKDKDAFRAARRATWGDWIAR